MYFYPNIIKGCIIDTKYMESFTLHPIGYIHSPYLSIDQIPRNAQYDKIVEASITLLDKYQDGLMDLDGFSHANIIFYFHESTQENLLASPPFDSKIHGIFATRSPHRPNHIGLSTVKIKKIEKNQLYFHHVDMIDGTPVLDIKPFNPFSDNLETYSLGWLEKHMVSEDSQSIRK